MTNKLDEKNPLLAAAVLSQLPVMVMLKADEDDDDDDADTKLLYGGDGSGTGGRAICNMEEGPTSQLHFFEQTHLRGISISLVYLVPSVQTKRTLRFLAFRTRQQLDEPQLPSHLAILIAFLDRSI